MVDPRRVELTLLGQAISVRTEATPDYLKSLARYLEERVLTLQRSGVQDAHKALILAALDITDELFHAREAGTEDDTDVSKRIAALVAMLDSATRP